MTNKLLIWASCLDSQIVAWEDGTNDRTTTSPTDCKTLSLFSWPAPFPAIERLETMLKWRMIRPVTLHSPLSPLCIMETNRSGSISKNLDIWRVAHFLYSDEDYYFHQRHNLHIVSPQECGRQDFIERVLQVQLMDKNRWNFDLFSVERRSGL